MLICASLVCLIGCASRRTATAGMAEVVLPQRDQVWQLVEMRGKALPPTEASFTLVMNVETLTIHGTTPCNDYMAPIVITPSAKSSSAYCYGLTISSLISGEVQCPDADMNAQERYLALLGKVDAMEFDDNALSLLRTGRVVLKFEMQ